MLQKIVVVPLLTLIDLLMLGVLGAGRAGVQLAEYGSGADRERALLQAGLLQQGFGQGQAAAQQALANQLGLAGAQQQFSGALQGLSGQQFGQAGLSGATTLGTAATALGGAQPMLTAAQGLAPTTGAQATAQAQDFMSPFQQRPLSLIHI